MESNWLVDLMYSDESGSLYQTEIVVPAQDEIEAEQRAEEKLIKDDPRMSVIQRICKGMANFPTHLAAHL